jgi:DegV family protein with EDD domain
MPGDVMALQKIKIMTDSGSDVPLELEAQYDIRVLPFALEVNGKGYYDRVDFTHEEFYEVLKTSVKTPTHAQITAMQFEEIYAGIQAEGYTDLIYISINAKGSATNGNAQMARDSVYAEHPDWKETFRIYVVDAGTYSIGYGYPTVEAAKKAEKGVPAKEIVAYLEDWFQNCRVYFAPYTLEFVKRSGRVSCAAAFVGELMGLKPLIVFEEGEAKTISKVRGERAVVPAIAKLALSKMIPHTPYCIIQGCNPRYADALAAEMEKATGYPPAMIGKIGAVISINAGPDVVAVVIRQKDL